MMWLFWAVDSDSVWLRLLACFFVVCILYSLITLTARCLRYHRPPRCIIRFLCLLSILATAFLLASILLKIEYITAPTRKFCLGSGSLIYWTTNTPFATLSSPIVRAKFAPCVDELIGVGYVCMGHSKAGAWRQVVMPLWPLVVTTVLLSWILRDLRFSRFPINTCKYCDYDLSGSVSRRCPECGSLM